MSDIRSERLLPFVAQRIKPFIEEVLIGYPENMHSIHIVGSSVTEDFHEKTSDINTIFVLKDMDLKFIKATAPLGKKYKENSIAAPLIMTPEYIMRSLDVFPIEFLDFHLIHETVFGKDILKDIEINKVDLRNQCEREVKIKLIGLIQGYISSLGDKSLLTERLVNSIAGYLPLFRGIIFLMGKEPPIRRHEVLSALSAATEINTDIFRRILDIKKRKLKLTKDELYTVFDEYYIATEKIGKIIDELQV